MAEWQTRRT